MSFPYEENMANALDASSPADVIQSNRLLPSFRAFFARGSTSDVWQLLPEDTVETLSPQSSHTRSPSAHEDSDFARSISSHQDASPSPSRRGRRSTRRRAGASQSSRQPSNLRTVYDQSDTEPAAPDEVQEAFEFFSARIPTQQRIHGLMRVLEGIYKAPHQPAHFYREIWSAQKNNVFCAKGSSESRISRLFHGRKLIDQEHQRFEDAGRLSLVFLAHDIETIKDQDWKLGPGQSRQHAAVLWISKHLDVNPEEVKKEWRRSRNYLRLLEVCGPASLLELGTGVNWYWEKALTKEDVDVFIEFQKQRMPERASRIQEMNRVAGQMVMDGMVAYGWTCDAMIKTKTRLRNALAIHCPEVLSPVVPQPEFSLSGSPEVQMTGFTSLMDQTSALMAPFPESVPATSSEMNPNAFQQSTLGLSTINLDQPLVWGNAIQTPSLGAASLPGTDVGMLLDGGCSQDFVGDLGTGMSASLGQDYACLQTTGAGLDSLAGSAR